ncbi:hypothetical protein Esti_000283 [Eimeria stiedai]
MGRGTFAGLPWCPGRSLKAGLSRIARASALLVVVISLLSSSAAFDFEAECPLVFRWRRLRLSKMRPRLCVLGSWALLFGLGSFDSSALVSASWTLKRLAGSQWRNGNRMLAEALGRTPTEIKSALAGASPAFQEQYKQLAERFADCDEAKRKSSSPTETAALEEHMKHLKAQVEAMLSGVLGPRTAGARGQQQQQVGAPFTGSGAGAQAARGGAQGRQGVVPGVGEDAVLDPLQQQMLLLQQRQQQELQQVVQQLQQSQQQERQRMEQQLREAREQHLAVQRESQVIRSYLVGLEAQMRTIQQRVNQLAGYEQAIEEMTLRLEGFMRVLTDSEEEGEGAAPQPAHLQAAGTGIYVQLKASLGQLLAAVNHGMQAVLEGVEKAEERAAALADLGASGKQLSEQLLQLCASFRVSLTSQEEYLAEVVTALETKQVRCDATVERLKTALDAAYARYAGTLRASVLQRTQDVVLKTEELRAAIAAGAQQLKEQLQLEIQRGSTTPEQLRQLQGYTGGWVSTIEESLVSFDGLLEDGQRLTAAAAAMPPEHAVQTTDLQRSLQAAVELKKEVRHHKAKVQQLLRVLETRVTQAQQQQQMAQQQMVQQQQGLSGVSHVQPSADPYAMYSRPTVLTQQQQQQPQQQQFPGEGAVGAPYGAAEGGPGFMGHPPAGQVRSTLYAMGSVGTSPQTGMNYSGQLGGSATQPSLGGAPSTSFQGEFGGGQ